MNITFLLVQKQETKSKQQFHQMTENPTYLFVNSMVWIINLSLQYKLALESGNQGPIL